jgi:hypothetical protein
MSAVISREVIINKIYFLRGKKVMLDKDLAELYGVTTFRLNEQVKRNKKRFPPDFRFQLSKKEFKNLISQFAISSWGGTRKAPYAFTEQGVAMLSSVLNSERAVQVNIQIIRVFTKLRNVLAAHKELRRKIEDIARMYGTKLQEHDGLIADIFRVLNRLIEPPERPKKKKFGFLADRQ